MPELYEIPLPQLATIINFLILKTITPHELYNNHTIELYYEHLIKKTHSSLSQVLISLEFVNKPTSPVNST
ncbi:hypothetical protein HK096_000472, partial [Nowakowskiella sp. JEL0078]